MKYQIMIDILFILLERRHVHAGELARRYEVSVRTIFRYIDEMTIAGIPITITRGPNGGISISDAYKLPKGFMTRDEYARTLDAMQAMQSELNDPVLQRAIQKITSQIKREDRDNALKGNILVDSGPWNGDRNFSEKLSLLSRATDEREALEIDYVSRNGEHTRRVILPHLLVYKQNIWYVYAYCRLREEFRLFKVGRMRAIVLTGERFERTSISRDDVPLSFWTDTKKSVDARFAIAREALPFAEEWLGIENVYERDGEYFADVTLPDDQSLIGQILSAGALFRVLAPASLAERVRQEAERIATAYAAP